MFSKKWGLVVVISLAVIGCKLDLGFGESSSGDIPQAVNDTATTAANTPVTMAVLANDSASGGGTLTITGVSQPAHGQAVINSDQTVTYTPTANFSGQDSFTYTISNGQHESGATVTVTVTPPVNPAPTISSIANQTIMEDTTTGPLAFTVGDADTPVETLAITARLDNPALLPNANLVLAGNGASRTITATPAANANGSTVITVTVSNGTATTSTTFTLTVTPVNDPPVRTAGSVNALTLTINAGLTSLGFGGLAYSPGPVDESNQTLTYTITQVPDSRLGDIVLADGVTVVSINTSYTLAELQGTQFRTASYFVAAAGTGSFAFSVIDNGGTANGGADTLTESLTVTVKVMVREGWRQYYNGQGSSNNYPEALAVDTAGNAYITGWSEFINGNSSNVDFATTKYDAAGNRVWEKTYSFSENSSDYAEALAVDATGNIYVAGSIYDITSSKLLFVIVKYDANGNEVKAVSYDNAYNYGKSYYNGSQILAVDAAGNVYMKVTAASLVVDVSVY